MARLFACLAVLQLLLLAATGVVGLLKLDPGADRHVLLGVFSLLLSCLVQVVVFTYFTVTGKMISQAIHLGRLDGSRLESVRQFKKRCTYNLAFVVAAIVAVTTTGASHWRTGESAMVHVSIAGICLLVHGVVFYRQFDLILRNHRLFEGTLHEYTARREASKRKGPVGPNAGSHPGQGGGSDSPSDGHSARGEPCREADTPIMNAPIDPQT